MKYLVRNTESDIGEFSSKGGWFPGLPAGEELVTIDETMVEDLKERYPWLEIEEVSDDYEEEEDTSVEEEESLEESEEDDDETEEPEEEIEEEEEETDYELVTDNLTTRTANSLEEAGLETLAELEAFEGDYTEIEGIGEKGKEEIEELL